jgi:hypothetical protein
MFIALSQPSLLEAVMRGYSRITIMTMQQQQPSPAGAGLQAQNPTAPEKGRFEENTGYSTALKGLIGQTLGRESCQHNGSSRVSAAALLRKQSQGTAPAGSSI